MIQCENPIIVQDGDVETAVAPLFLIHDGGGTVYSYFMLDELDRPVYGISNPYFGTGQKWKNGIGEPARLYAQMIKEIVRRGNILLGGWSLGGLLSLEIAHIFSNDPDIHVQGITMIDTACPLDKEQVKLDYDDFRSQTTDVRTGTAQSAHACMLNAFEMIKQWTHPIGSPSPPTILLRATEACDSPWSSLPVSSTSSVRSRQPSPSPSCSSESSSRASLDDGALGWKRYGALELRHVFQIPGNHFSLFGDSNVEELTQKLKLSCDLLEGNWKGPTP